MKPKKNPKADLNRSSGLFFVIGLTIALFVTWRLLEYRSYESLEEFTQVINVLDEMDEEVPVTEQVKTVTPPPPPAVPEVIEIVEDVEEIEETVIESTESGQDMEIAEAEVDVDDVDVGEYEEEEVVPFAVIENAPIFPGCEHLRSEAERRACFNEKVQEHITANFRYPEMALEMGISGRVFVTFEISSKGQVTNIRQRGPDRMLEDEAKRIISSLPKMTPGKQRGRAAKVNYSIPIMFKMADL